MKEKLWFTVHAGGDPDWVSVRGAFEIEELAVDKLVQVGHKTLKVTVNRHEVGTTVYSALTLEGSIDGMEVVAKKILAAAKSFRKMRVG